MEHPPELTREEVERMLAGSRPHELHLVPLSVALHSDDVLWAEEVCARLAGHGDAQVRGNALLGFGQLARRFGSLSLIAQVLVQAGTKDADASVRERAAAASDEIHRHLRGPR